MPIFLDGLLAKGGHIEVRPNQNLLDGRNPI